MDDKSRSMNNVETACNIARKGLRVFPYYHIIKDENGDLKCGCGENREPGEEKEECKALGKHPAVRGWPSKATSDPNRVPKMWRDLKFGIAISTANLVTLDLDGLVGVDGFEILRKELNLPPTFVIRSGNVEPGHRHYPFRLPPGTKVVKRNCSISTVDSRFSKIDIKSGSGNNIAAPGTLHKSGGRYAWDFEHGLGEPEYVDDIPMAPESLVEFLGGLEEDLEPPTGGHHEPGSDGDIAHKLACYFPIDASGVRHTTILKAAGYLMGTQHLDPARAISLLKTHLMIYNDFFKTPLDEAIDEMEKQVYYASRTVERMPSTQEHAERMAVAALDPQFIEAVEEATGALREKCHRGVKTKLPTLREFMSQEQHEPLLTNRVRHGEEFDRLCYMYAIALIFQYERGKTGTDSFRMTDRQIVDVIRRRFGFVISKDRRLKFKNQLVGGNKADGTPRSPVLELVTCLEPSTRRRPSLYEPALIAGVRLAESADEPEEAQTPPESLEPAEEPREPEEGPRWSRRTLELKNLFLQTWLQRKEAGDPGADETRKLLIRHCVKHGIPEQEWLTYSDICESDDEEYVERHAVELDEMMRKPSKQQIAKKDRLLEIIRTLKPSSSQRERAIQILNNHCEKHNIPNDDIPDPVSGKT